MPTIGLSAGAARFFRPPVRIDQFLKRHFVHVITVTVAVGALFPELSNRSKDVVLFNIPGTAWPFDLLTLSLYLMMLSASVGCDPRDFGRLARAPRAVTLSLVLFYVLLPLVAWGVSVAAKHSIAGEDGMQFGAGILLVVLMPVAMTSNIWVRLARGDLSLSIAMTTVTTALSVAATPVYLALFLDLSSNDIAVPSDTIARLLLVCIVVPLIMGMSLRQLAPTWVRRWQPLFGVGGALGLQLAVFANIGKAVPALTHVRPLVLVVMVLFMVLLSLLNFGIAYAAGRFCKLDYANQAALTFAGGMRSNGTALVVGLKSFPAYPLVIVPAAIYIVLQHLFAAPFVRILRALVPYAEAVVDRPTLFTEVERVRRQRPRKVTLALLAVSGTGDDDGAALSLAKIIRVHTNAADLVAVEGSTLLVALIARHDDPPELILRARSLWTGPPITLHIAHQCISPGEPPVETVYFEQMVHTHWSVLA